MKNAIIIDGNNLMYRALKSFHLSYKGKSTGIIYGFPNILRSLITLLSANEVYVVFDGGKRAQYRLSLLPDYKKRDKGDDFDFEDFKRQKEVVIETMKILGVPVIMHGEHEADDIIWLITRRLKRARNVIIVSTDKDFNQLLSKRVSIWNPFKDKRITHKNLKSINGYEPHETVDYLILDGDKSDNIPGMPGFGKATIRKFLDEFGSIEAYLKSNSSFKNKSKKEIEKVFLLNRRLIDIRIFLRRTKISLKSLGIKLKPESKGVNESALSLLIARYDLRSFNKDSFKKAYNQLDYGNRV